nr:scopoletin glucosyltransferase-like isoform X2 [Quercus suber]
MTIIQMLLSKKRDEMKGRAIERKGVMGSKSRQLHLFFFPFMGHGHLIPMMDTAKLFAARGVKATIVTTPRNVQLFSKTHGTNIDIQIIKFPAVEAGLPEGCENIDSVTSLDMSHKFIKATKMLRQPLEQLLEEYQPSCLVADMFLPWATDVAAKFGIPSFPGEIKLTRMQLADFTLQEVETDFSKLFKEAIESELTSYGVVVNSFYELEPAYADHYRKVLGRRAWHIGPVSLCNKDSEDKAQRGKEASIADHECLKWLCKKKPNSVIYICLGSMPNFSDSQLFEIAMGLEASEQQFIWVVRKGKNEKEEEDWLPEGFEKRMEGKGLIIRGWAPQVLILDHEAVGGFVTHCGWNSTLEGVASGVPMVTWPMASEQFYNEKLITQVLKIGISVGAQQWTWVVDGIKREAIEKAMRQILVGEEAARAKALGEMARKAVEEGGSSYSDLNALIEELRLYCL